MEANRRRFLKQSAMAAATAAVLRPSDANALPLLQENNADGIQWQKAPCRFCGTGCHVQVGVDQGRVVAVAGDQHAEVNKGLLCVKGYHVGSILYGKDRLTQPLLRKGDGYVSISWDEAIDTIAKRIMPSTPRRVCLLRVGTMDDSRRICCTEIHEGRTGQQPHRPQRTALHGIGCDGIYWRRTGSTNRPAATTTWTNATWSSPGGTTQRRCTRCCSHVLSTVARGARRYG